MKAKKRTNMTIRPMTITDYDNCYRIRPAPVHATSTAFPADFSTMHLLQPISLSKLS